jgi:hypothetical protein
MKCFSDLGPLPLEFSNMSAADAHERAVHSLKHNIIRARALSCSDCFKKSQGMEELFSFDGAIEFWEREPMLERANSSRHELEMTAPQTPLKLQCSSASFNSPLHPFFLPQTPLALKPISLSFDSPSIENSFCITPIKQEICQSTDFKNHFSLPFVTITRDIKTEESFFEGNLELEHPNLGFCSFLDPSNSSTAPRLANSFSLSVVAVTVFAKVATKVLDFEGLAASFGTGAFLRLRDFRNSMLYSLHSTPLAHSTKMITGRVFANGTLTVNSLKTFAVQPVVQWVDSQISALCNSNSCESSIFAGREDASNSIFKLSVHLCMSLPFCVVYENLLQMFEAKQNLGKFQVIAIRSQLPCESSLAEPVFSSSSSYFYTGGQGPMIR